MSTTHTEDRRVQFDFEVDFSNGGGIQGQGFRLDIDGDDIVDAELAAYIVKDLRLLMVGAVRILNKTIINERHKRAAAAAPAATSVDGRWRVDLSHTIEDGMITYRGLPAPVVCDYLARELQMPLERIRDVLAAPDPATRNALIASHLDALQESLAQTQAAVASLRNLLDGGPEAQALPVTHKNVEATPAASISDTVEIEGLGLWLRGALGELRATLTAQDVLVAGPAGGIYDDDLFENERGQGTVFVPCVGELQAVGRVRFTVIPEAELATVTHHGTLEGLDVAYGALAAHVARHELGITGPVREYYTVADTDTPDSSAWRTEIGVPIFSTGERA